MDCASKIQLFTWNKNGLGTRGDVLEVVVFFLHSFSLSMHNGQCCVWNEDTKYLQKLYSLLVKHCEERGYAKPSLGYFTVVTCDYEHKHKEYIPAVNAEED
jgi:hypothetical protein